MSCDNENTITKKQEESLVFTCIYLESDGQTPVNLTGFDIQSTVKNTTGAVLIEGSVTITDVVNGEFTIDYGSTNVTGSYIGDIAIIKDNRVIKTETFNLRILPSPTVARIL